MGFTWVYFVELIAGLGRGMHHSTPKLHSLARRACIEKLIRLACLGSVGVSFVMLSQAVFAKVVFEVSPHHVSMVRAVLSVVVL